MSSLGNLIDRMIVALQIRRDVPMSLTIGDLAKRLVVSSDTVYKWRGTVRPNHDTVARLVEIGVREAYMDNAWAVEMLQESAHPDIARILMRLYSPNQLALRHNLPAKSYQTLVGRHVEFKRIRELLDLSARQATIPIEGVGGSGKTALAMEVGWACLEDYLVLPAGRRFDAIVWATAKRDWLLTAHGIVERHATLNNLVELYRTIGEVLEDTEVLKRPSTSTVLAAMRLKGRVLLILDNLEAIDSREILSFLRDVPSPHKVLVTLRYHEDLPAPIRLKGLTDADMRQLVEQESEVRGLELDREQITDVVKYARGLPLAATIAAGMLNVYGTLPDASGPRDEASLVDFLYKNAVSRLDRDSLRAWFALSYFVAETGATPRDLAGVLGLNADLDHERETCRRWMHQLYVLNLVTRDPVDGSYAMVGFTHQYCRTQAAKDEALDGADRNRVLEPKARERWVDWSTRFARDRVDLIAKDERTAFNEIYPQWDNFPEMSGWSRKHQDLETAYAFHKDIWLASPVGLCGEVFGKWERCLENLNWLAYQAQERGDIAVIIAARSQMGRLYALQERFEDAARELPSLEEAKDHHRGQRIGTALYLCLLLNHVMLEFPSRTDAAPRPLDRAQQLLKQVEPLLEDPQLSDLERGQLHVRYCFYQAKRARVEGDRGGAARRFRVMLDASERPEGNRMRTYALRYLALLAFEDGDGAATRKYVAEGLEIADQYHDVLQIARLKEALSNLNQREGELEQAKRDLSEAADRYDELNMKADATKSRKRAGEIGEDRGGDQGSSGTGNPDARNAESRSRATPAGNTSR